MLSGFSPGLMLVVFAAALILPPYVFGQTSGASSTSEWDKVVDAARKEGKVTISIPASADKAGLPIKALPVLKEGTCGTGGSGNLAILKNPAQPNATKVFVNWLLSREGQEVTLKALGQATRRLDVDTKSLRETGVIPAKDQMSVKDFWQIENQSEEKLDKVREPAQKFAQALLH